MNKKIILVTLFDDNNIGNRLQNYALQKILMSYGIEVVTLNNGYTTQPTLKMTVKAWIQSVLGILGLKNCRRKYQKYIADKKRRTANIEFDRNNIKKIININNDQAFQIDWSEYEVAIAGSDQIWHKWREEDDELPYYYLQFMPPEKRCAYAASFGFEEFPDKDLEQHEKGLKGMRYISCREQSGCDLIKGVIGKEVPRVLDPTLLMKAEEWRKIEGQASDFAKNQKNYAFLYFLGEQTDEYNVYMEQIVRTKDIERIIDFSDYTNSDICECGPSDFLSLIDNARYVFTDSFHCTVFSLLFEKEFTVFRRKQIGFEKMFGRVEDLLASKGKLQHIYGGSKKEATNDFDDLYLCSMQYIDKILNIIS